MMRSMGELALNGQQPEQQVPRTKMLHGKEEEKQNVKQDLPQKARKYCHPEAMLRQPKKPWASQEEMQQQMLSKIKTRRHARAQEEKR